MRMKIQLTFRTERLEPINMDEITITIDGQTLSVPAGITILQAAQSAGVEIPTICYHEATTPNALCRTCVVEVDATYYALPSQRNAQLWADRTPADFVFGVKAFDSMPWRSSVSIESSCRCDARAARSPRG